MLGSRVESRTRPVDAAGTAGLMDGAHGRAAHKPLDGGRTDAAAHSPLENRARTAARFPTAPTGRACVVRSMSGK